MNPASSSSSSLGGWMQADGGGMPNSPLGHVFGRGTSDATMRMGIDIGTSLDPSMALLKMRNSVDGPEGRKVPLKRNTPSPILSREYFSRWPQEFLGEIEKGDVVAFIGAGFSRPAGLPLWKDMVLSIAKEAKELNQVNDVTLSIVEKLVNSGNPQNLDLAAQILSDGMGAKLFEDDIRKRLTVDMDSLPQVMQDRLKWIRGIPFAAIITTNYDNLLHGVVKEDKDFAVLAREILRERKTGFQLLEDIVFNPSKSSVPCIKLHGDVSNPLSRLVATREAYRSLLHDSSQYTQFVRTLMATHTVLYIGFSFSDTYLNEMRSEVMSMFQRKGDVMAVGLDSKPLGYAIIPDVDDVQAKAMLLHEGIRIISFSTNGGKHFGEFDQLLHALYRMSNPVVRFGMIVNNKRLLWVHEECNSWCGSTFIKDFIVRANESGTVVIDMASNANEALHMHRQNRYDCMISVFDEHRKENQGEETFKLLRGVWKEPDPMPCPIVAFGSSRHADERNGQVIQLGGRCYTSHYYELFRNIAKVLHSVGKNPRNSFRRSEFPFPSPNAVSSGENHQSPYLSLRRYSSSTGLEEESSTLHKRRHGVDDRVHDQTSEICQAKKSRVHNKPHDSEGT